MLKSEAAEFEILRSFDIWAKKTNKPTCMDEVGAMQYEHKAIERAKERYGDSILNGTTLDSWLSDNSLLTHL
ncbi:hypothetical protein A152_0021830 [Vibrio tasmaniensis 1F-187]|uniref:hypothetical protein n=1 Tax=unclassified Vibrio TaxID=2614977 RepID=UPI001112CBA6|nr:hypothetical protein [Vibrio tasmaniensis]